MDLKLKDKRALITGASRGLGFAAARGLAMEGAKIAINSRDAEKLKMAAESIKEDTGITAIIQPGDITEPETIKRVVQNSADSMGGLDILITNAGGTPPGAFESFDEETWAKAIDLSFMSHVRLIRAALPHLRRSSAASVLTITSYSVKQPIPNLILSNSIRAATVGLTKTLALEIGPEGIRFNSILPAWTETERVLEIMDFRASQSGRSREEEIAQQAEISPMGRMGKPEEFANAAVFLVSPAASYITGTMLTVDGGMYKGTL